MCRAVIVTGLPFAPYLDPKVKLKRDFLDTARASERKASSAEGGFGDDKSDKERQKSQPKTLSGAEWYNQQAHRAVNQAIGRVIRHKNDYGAVLFLDHRFADPRNSQGLSKWLRPYLADETFGASTRSMVQFFKEAKLKTEIARPVLKYEEPTQKDTRSSQYSSENQVTQIAVVSSAVDGDNDAFIPESRIRKRFDLNQPSIKEESSVPLSLDASTQIVDAGAATSINSTLAQAYIKRNQPGTSLLDSSSLTNKETPSIWTDLDSKARPFTQLKSNAIKLSSSKGHVVTGTKEDAKQQAKVFFDTAKQVLSKEDLLKTQQLLVSMKTYGGEKVYWLAMSVLCLISHLVEPHFPDKKAQKEYISTAKSLLLLLVGINQKDQKRMKLIALLFPLLPIKFRYTLEKMGRKLCFEKSALYGLCKSRLSEPEFETIQKAILQLILDDSASPHNSVSDYSISEKAIFEDIQKVLSLLSKSDIDPNHLFALLSQRHLIKARSISNIISQEKEKAKAKQKGESCINPALFQRSRPKAYVPMTTEQPQPVDTQNMVNALSQGKAIHAEKKARITQMQNHSRENKRTFNKLTSSTQITSKHTTTSRLDDVDALDKFLNQVKSVAYKPRIERLNGKIKANVPKSVVCTLCNTYPKEASPEHVAYNIPIP
jgi:hypothetical protein